MVTTKRPDPKTTSKDERTRLAVVAFYKGEIEQRDIVKCYGNVSRQLVVDLARKLPQGLVDDDERLQLWRGSHRAVGLALPNRAHTDAEYRDGIYKYASGAMKQDEVFGKYGVKPTALKARVRDLKTANGGSLPPRGGCGQLSTRSSSAARARRPSWRPTRARCSSPLWAWRPTPASA